MSRPARLVARREILALLRSRGRLVLLVGVVALGAVAAVGLSRNPHRVTHYRIGFLPAGTVLAARMQAEAPVFGAKLTLVALSPSTVDTALQRGQVALVTVNAQQVTSDRPLSLPLRQLTASTQLGLQSRAIASSAARGHPGASSGQLPPVVALPTTQPRSRARSAAAAAVALTGLALYLFMIFLSSSVVEEKASRVIELLFAAARPREVLAGKLLGVGVVGLATTVALVATGEIAAAVTGVFSGRVLLGGVAAVVGAGLAFVLYGSVYAVVSARVSQPDDLQYAQLPATLLLSVAVVLAGSVTKAHAGSIAAVLALVPLTGPLLEPARIALGQADLLEVIACFLLSGATALVALAWALRSYSRLALQFGPRVSLGTALSFGRGRR